MYLERKRFRSFIQTACRPEMLEECFKKTAIKDDKCVKNVDLKHKLSDLVKNATICFDHFKVTRDTRACNT